MPVSVVCESTANVNAALRESLGSGYASGGHHGGVDDAKGGAATTGNGAGGSNGSNADDSDCLQSKLAATAKRVLLSKIDYEEVPNYSQSVLDSLKSKYIVLKPSNATNGGSNGSAETNGRASPACSNNNGNGITDTNGNSNNVTNSSNNNNNTNGSGVIAKRNNPNELPQPKRVLFPRENIHIGWKNSSYKWQVGVGMMNVGNTCYLNSTLQALFHVPSMAHWLMSDTQHREQCDSADDCIICAMVKTLQASQSSQSPIRPFAVYSKLRLICKHLVMGRQEDAHEFLRYLVEAMEKSYLARFRNYKELDQHSKETTPLNQILGGYLKSAVRCLACGHVSVTFQHFQDLLLDIRKADTIEEALEVYFSRERLEDMGYKCESCKKKVSATKQFSLERAPIALCIQLKRFSVMGTKLNKQITIKPRLDLNKFASRKNPGEQLTYRLVAMVTHLGASQHCGHYTAIGLTESGTYYNYDDSYVRSISEQSVCNTNAYIIFYELDNTSTRLGSSSTQIGGGEKENYQKVNGYTNSMNSCRASPQRIIGPQLPPGGLSNYTASSSMTANRSTVTNGNSPFANNNNANNNRKLNTNRLGVIPNSNNSNNNSNNNVNSKTIIHFKNHSSSTPVKSSASSSITTATATSSSSTPAAVTAGIAHSQQNGLLTGTGKFQEHPHTKSPLVGASNKRQTAAATNGNESSCSSDHEDEVSSSTQPAFNKASSGEGVCSSSRGAAQLPSMPKLFDTSTTSTTNTMKKSPTPVLTNKSQLKSLVPYGSESDDESASGETKRIAKKAPVKRRSSDSSSDNTDDEDDKPTNGIKIKKAATSTATSASSLTSSSNSQNGSASNNGTNGSQQQQSKAARLQQQKTDPIREIFNVKKTNANNLSNGTSNNGPCSSPMKKKKSQIPALVSSTTPATDSDSDKEPDDSNATRPPFKRSHSTPPSPPVIKTKTGLWQVTTLQPVTACVSPPEAKAATTTTPKNPKNPFASKTPTETFAKRPKYSGSAGSLNKEKRSAYAGNGYQRDAVSDSAVNELLKQSHRGYGAPVLSWNGTQTEIEKEVISEAREQRQRDWEDEEETEMDRGRQKKVKGYKDAAGHHSSNNRTPGYNPFQEQQEQQRRWKHGVGQRFYYRSKFRFQRFNRMSTTATKHHRHQMSHNSHSNGSGNSNGGNGYSRRDS